MSVAGTLLCAAVVALPSTAEETKPKGTVAEVRSHNGVPTLFINGGPMVNLALAPIGDLPTEVCRDFSKAGIRIYTHIIWNWMNITPGKQGPLREANRWWLGEGRYDFDKFDHRLKAIIVADPDAYIFPRVKLNPPDWWLETHPDDRVQYEDGSKHAQHSMASRAWEASYERMLRDMIRHVESSDYADRIIGYQPAGGSSSEWIWWGSYNKGATRYLDYSPAARSRFRDWLRDRYANNMAELRRAWRDENVTFETAEPPSSKFRTTTEYGLFRDAAVARPAIDYMRFMSDIKAHNIVRSCRIVKEETGGRKIAGVLYGYMLHFAHTGTCTYNDGMCGLKQVLESPYVDFLSSPSQYEAQDSGDPGLFQSGYFGSYRLHNKLFFQDADIRTHLVNPSYAYGRKVASDLPDTLGLMGREFGNTLTEMVGLWWSTLAGDDSFRDEGIMSRVARFSDEARQVVEHRGLRRPDVAIFHSEESYFHMKWGPGAVTFPLVTDMRRKLSRSGVPQDYYLISDIANPDLPDYKLYVFLNPFYLPNDLREAIARKVRRNNAVAVWFYAPGFIQENGSFSEEAIESLTGIRVRHVRQEAKLGLKITDRRHPITANEKGDHLPGSWKDHPVDPVFYADDPAATALGTLTPTGKAGLVVREFGDWRSVYFASVPMTTNLFRGLAQYAGCHVYSTTDDVFNGNSRYLMLYTSSIGPKVISLPGTYDVRDIVSNSSMGQAVSKIHFDAQRIGEAHLFELVPRSKSP